MRSIFNTFFAVVLYALIHATAATEPSGSVLEQALHAMQYGAGIKHGFRAEKTRAGRTNAFIETVLTTEDERIEKIYAAVLTKYVPVPDAETLLAFFRSPTGVRLIADQSVDRSIAQPKLSLSPEQYEEARVFSASAAVRRFRQATESATIQAEAGRALRASLMSNEASQ